MTKYDNRLELRLPTDLRNRLAQEAAKVDRSVGAVARRLLERALASDSPEAAWMHGTLNNVAGTLPIGLRDVAKARANYSAKELVWDGLDLRLGRKRSRVLATLEPDSKYPAMWRVRSDYGLSDMANRSWAKEAAVSIALRKLKHGGINRDDAFNSARRPLLG